MDSDSESEKWSLVRSVLKLQSLYWPTGGDSSDFKWEIYLYTKTSMEKLPTAKQFLEEFVGSVADMYFVNDGPH